MNRTNWETVGLLALIAWGAVSAALGCPFIRNLANFTSAGGLAAYVERLLAVHRKKGATGSEHGALTLVSAAMP